MIDAKRCSSLVEALFAGRQAVRILEAAPHDPDFGYDKDEVAQHYAASDRLVAAFRKLDSVLTKQGKQCSACSHGEHAGDGVDPICPCCKADTSSVR